MRPTSHLQKVLEGLQIMIISIIFTDGLLAIRDAPCAVDAP